MRTTTPPMTSPIAIIGSGFAGTWAALSAHPVTAEVWDGVEWRACDLFSLLDAEQALEGADLAVYLPDRPFPLGPDSHVLPESRIDSTPKRWYIFCILHHSLSHSFYRIQSLKRK